MSEKKNNQLLNDKQHELMLEAARYTVLFTAVVIFNVVWIIVGVGYYLYKKELLKFNDDIANARLAYIGSTMLVLFLTAKEILLLLAIQLSFQFSHTKYLKICGRCDRCVKERYHKLAWKRNRAIAKVYDLQVPLLAIEMTKS